MGLSWHSQRIPRTDAPDALLSPVADPRHPASESVQFASELNALAESCFGETAPARALWLQRAELVRLSGKNDEARRLRARAKAIPLRTAMDRFWDVLDRLDVTEHQDLKTEIEKRRDIMADVQQISRVDPQNFVNWLLLGNCYVRLKQLHEAKNCYTTGVALEPGHSWSYVNRGLVCLGPMASRWPRRVRTR